MDELANLRMRKNFHRALLCLVLGLAALAVSGPVWHGLSGDGEAAPSSGVGAVGQDMGLAEMMKLVIDDDGQAEGEPEPELPEGFLDECLDPRVFGEVRSSSSDGVVGIVSPMSDGELLAACEKTLAAKGWLQLADARQTQSTFVKARGELRWLFLGTSKVSEGSVAVMVVRGQR